MAKALLVALIACFLICTALSASANDTDFEKEVEYEYKQFAIKMRRGKVDAQR